jgi:hypothetical protein
MAQTLKISAELLVTNWSDSEKLELKKSYGLIQPTPESTGLLHQMGIRPNSFKTQTGSRPGVGYALIPGQYIATDNQAEDATNKIRVYGGSRYALRFTEYNVQTKKKIVKTFSDLIVTAIQPIYVTTKHDDNALYVVQLMDDRVRANINIEPSTQLFNYLPDGTETVIGISGVGGPYTPDWESIIRLLWIEATGISTSASLDHQSAEYPDRAPINLFSNGKSAWNRLFDLLESIQHTLYIEYNDIGHNSNITGETFGGKPKYIIIPKDEGYETVLSDLDEDVTSDSARARLEWNEGGIKLSSAQPTRYNLYRWKHKRSLSHSGLNIYQDEVDFYTNTAQLLDGTVAPVGAGMFERTIWYPRPDGTYLEYPGPSNPGGTKIPNLTLLEWQTEAKKILTRAVRFDHVLPSINRQYFGLFDIDESPFYSREYALEHDGQGNAIRTYIVAEKERIKQDRDNYIPQQRWTVTTHGATDLSTADPTDLDKNDVSIISGGEADISLSYDVYPSAIFLPDVKGKNITSGLIPPGFGNQLVLVNNFSSEPSILGVMDADVNIYFYPIRSSQVSGSGGDATTQCSYTYEMPELFSIGNFIDPTVAPHRHQRPAVGFHLPATFALISLSQSSVLHGTTTPNNMEPVILFVNEVLQTEACPDA